MAGLPAPAAGTGVAGCACAGATSSRVVAAAAPPTTAPFKKSRRPKASSVMGSSLALFQCETAPQCDVPDDAARDPDAATSCAARTAAHCHMQTTSHLDRVYPDHGRLDDVTSR